MKQITLAILITTSTVLSKGQNVGIGTTTPGFPLNFSNALGDKISLYGNSGNHYGFGIQGGLLQMYSDAAAANISFGFGSSAAFTERMRIINSGADGLLLNGRIVLRNGTLPNDPAQGPGIWLYKPDNLGQLLGFMGAQNNQNMGFFGGPAGWGFTYDAINSRVGINTATPTSLLNVNGQVTIDQKNFGGYGGLLLKGNTPGSNHPNIAFTIKNNAATPADVVGAMIQGDLVNSTANGESIDLTFLTANNGFGSLSEKLRIKGNGALAVNGITGNNQQLLISNGSGSAATWTSAGNIIQTGSSPFTVNLALSGTGTYNLSASTYTVYLTVPGRVILLYRSKVYKHCEIGECSTKYELNVYKDGTFINSYQIPGVSYSTGINDIFTDATCGPDYIDLPAGFHTFTFTARNLFNSPTLFEFKAYSTIIPQ